MKIPISKLPDEDMQKAPAALVRAAQRARQLAEQTGTEFVVVRDGKLVREIPKPAAKKALNKRRKRSATDESVNKTTRKRSAAES